MSPSTVHISLQLMVYSFCKTLFKLNNFEGMLSKSRTTTLSNSSLRTQSSILRARPRSYTIEIFFFKNYMLCPRLLIVCICNYFFLLCLNVFMCSLYFENNNNVVIHQRSKGYWCVKSISCYSEGA